VLVAPFASEELLDALEHEWATLADVLALRRRLR
jgi:hypothetical protein